MSTDSTLTADRLREVLDYDPNTGRFVRLRSVGRGRAGAEAGTTNVYGYRVVHVDGVVYPAARLAWLYVHGVWPTDQIDHRNGDGLDNRIANLREATMAQNRQNMHGPHHDNRSGFLGVSATRSGRRWFSRIMIDRKVINLGTFDTPEAASVAYLAAKRELHPFWIGADFKETSPGQK